MGSRGDSDDRRARVELIMHLLSRLHCLWWNLAHRRSVNDALDDEVRSYVDLLAAEHEKNGMTPPMARRAALVETRGIEHVKESTRDAWVGDTLASTTRELRYALRSLRRSPAFVAIAVATLAIGIGGATAVFSAINASLLRPIPAVAVLNQLISLERVLPNNALDEISYPDYLDFREQTTTLTGLAAYDGTSMGLDDRLTTFAAVMSKIIIATNARRTPIATSRGVAPGPRALMIDRNAICAS